jgi:hypothetical protein
MTDPMTMLLTEANTCEDAQSRENIDDRTPPHARYRTDLVIRNDEGEIEGDLDWEGARAAIKSRYTPEDEVWIDLPEDEDEEESEDDDDDREDT